MIWQDFVRDIAVSMAATIALKLSGRIGSSFLTLSKTALSATRQVIHKKMELRAHRQTIQEMKSLRAFMSR